MRTRERIMLIVLLAVVSSLSAGVQAAVVTFHNDQPTPGPDDISNLVGATRDANNVGTTPYDTWLNDEWTYLALDRAAQGQTFVIGSAKPVCLLTGFWIRHVGYTENTASGTNNNGTWYGIPLNSKFGIRITDPSASGTAGFVLGSETYTVTRSEPNILPAGGTNTANGTGTWIHFVLGTPVPVAASKTYGFDVVSMTGNPNMFLETLGIKDTSPNPPGNPYPAGTAYRSGASGTGNNVLAVAPGDRVFLVELVGAPPSTASIPDPADKATVVPLDPVLSWNAGFNSTKSKVYFGIRPDSLSLETMINHQQGVDRYSYQKTGLAMSQTYYWRVDEVQQTGPDVVGNVWSFTTGTTKASLPSPAENEICVFVSPSPTLTWSAGLNSTQSKVYFGASSNSLALQATITHQQGVGRYSFQTGAVVNNQNYYWRVDEMQADASVITGDLWHFTTIPIIPVTDASLVGWWKFDEGPGKAIDWSGLNQHGVVYGGAESVPGYDGGAIAFDYVDDYVELPIGSTIASLNSTTIATWVKFPGTGETYQRIFNFGSNNATAYMYLTPNNGSSAPRFAITTTGSGGESGVDAPSALSSEWHHLAVTVDAVSRAVMLYLDGAAVATGSTQTLPADLGNTTDNWLGRSDDWVPPNPYLVGSLDDFRIYNKVLSRNEILTIMRGNPLLAWNPSPPNSSTPDIEHVASLTWSAGDKAAQHDVYFGTDANAVAGADTSTAGVYRDRQGAASYTPAEALQIGKSYYWRIDEINTDATISTGAVWSFTVAPYLAVDDYEAYDDVCNRIYYTWLDGGAFDANPTCGVAAYSGNGTASTVGNPFAERTIVHWGQQSMPVRYYNVNSPYYSEAQRQWTASQDWTRKGVKSLTLWFRGLAANAPASLYFVVEDSLGKSKTFTRTDPNDVLLTTWQRWEVDLKDVANAGVNLASIKKMTIGMDNRANIQTAGTGTMYFDDILLYPPRCRADIVKPTCDVNNDCIVDYRDLDLMANDWLLADQVVPATSPGATGLAALYAMENNVQDSSGNNRHGIANGDPVFVTSATAALSRALRFDGVDDYVDVQIGSVVAASTSMTAATWVNFPGQGGAWQRIFDFGSDTNIYMFLTPRQGTTGAMRFAITTTSGGGESDLDAPSTLATGWHHVAVVIDGTAPATMRLYVDGVVVATGTTAVLPRDLGQTTQNWLGRSQWAGDAYLVGSLDDFRIYTRALSAVEVAYLADTTPGDGRLHVAVQSPAEVYSAEPEGSQKINFRDYAVLAASWLQEKLWPQP